MKFLKQFLLVTIVSSAVCTSALLPLHSVRADDPPAEGGSAGGDAASGTSEELTVVNRSSGRAAKVAVVNAVINRVNNTRQVKINPECDFLPVDNDLLLDAAGAEDEEATQKAKDAKAGKGYARATFTVKNSDLKESHAWLGKLKPEVRHLVAGALFYDVREETNLGTAEKGDANTKFLAAWIGNRDTALFPSKSFITGIIDHQVFSTLIFGRGIRALLTAPDAQNVGEEAVVLDDFIWRFTIHRIMDGDIPVYRVFAKAELTRPFLLEFPASVKEAKVTVVVRFRNADSVIGIPQQIGSGDSTITIPENASEDLKTVEELKGGSLLEGLFKFGGGGDLQGGVSKGLFGGTANSSIYYGALAGQGRLKQMVGVNRLLTSDKSAQTGLGILFGVSPEKDNALFIGPSLKTGVFTLSAGAMALEKENAAGNTHTKVSSGVSFAVDLSQLIGGKNDVQAIPINGSSYFGGKSSAEIARDNQAASFDITLDPKLTVAQIQQLQSVQLKFERKRIFGADGRTLEAVTDAKDKRTLLVSVPPVGGKVVRIVPRGEYALTVDLPAGFVLNADGDPVDFSVPYIFGQEGDDGIDSFFFSITGPPIVP